MAGYLVHHRSYVSCGVRADYYRNDPYVWYSPYLWSFCHLNQRPRVERGMTILWLSKANGTFVCDLVFVVADILPFQAARDRFAPHDVDLAWHHFERGANAHPEVSRPDAKTYIADMQRSYIPHPAVPLDSAVDEVRRSERPTSKPLRVAWAKRTSPLRVQGIAELEGLVRARAEQRLHGPLDARWCSPGQEDRLR